MGTTALRSSTNASKFVIPPSLSSNKFLFCFLCAALALSCLSNSFMIIFSTKAANTGLKGHP